MFLQKSCMVWVIAFLLSVGICRFGVKEPECVFGWCLCLVLLCGVQRCVV